MLFGRRLVHPISIALAYAAFSAAWILLSDQLLPVFIGDLSVANLTRMQTLKGLLYVALTAGFIFLLIRLATTAITASRERLEEVESRYQRLFEKTGAMVLIVDAASGRIVDANPAALRCYGWTRDDLVGKNIADITVTSERDRLSEVI